MRIVQTVFGAFHHFDLARELQSRGHLECVFSTWPRLRLAREGLPPSKLKTFPWIHTPEYLLRRYGLLPHWLDDQLGYLNALSFDEYTLRALPACDALIAISGSSLKTGQRLQQRGGIFICDRGSTHQRYQEQIVSAEYRHWGIHTAVSDPRDTLREEAIYAAADAIVVPSSFAARSFVEMGVSPAKLHTIPYGVRLDNFAPVAQPPEHCFEVLFAGGVSLRKGVPYLIQAFANLKCRRKRLRLAGALEPGIQAIFAKLPMGDVEIMGSVPSASLPGIMGSSHVLVLPSIEDGMGLVLLQALASGCPVISTTNTGGPDLFTEGQEGFIVPIRDIAALTERMQQIANDPDLRQRMSVAGIDRMQTLGGWREYGDRWQSLLHRLTGIA